MPFDENTITMYHPTQSDSLSRIRAVLVHLFGMVVLLGWFFAPSANAQITHIRPDDETGTSAATVVDDVPLAHTDQFYALDGSGAVTSPGDLDAQVDKILSNIESALATVGAALQDVIKLNVYLERDELREGALSRLARSLPAEARPAISFVSTEMPHEGALLAMDAIAVSTAAAGDSGVQVSRSDALFGRPEQAHVAVLPAGAKTYVSGQAVRGEDLDAVGETMKGLHATLAYLGLSAEDVVQVKAFVRDMSQADAIEERIEEYFRTKPAPPIVLTEWLQDAYPAEIELIATRAASSRPIPGDDLLAFVTPPGASKLPIFSRVVEAYGGGLVYTSGLYGTPDADVDSQVAELFDGLRDLLSEAGTDVNHLVKATYYHSNDDAAGALGSIRREIYDPERPPAASRLSVPSVGLDGAIVTMDLIGVVRP